MAAYRTGAARQLLADLHALDYGTATDRDLCRLIGRTKVVLEHLLEVAEPPRRGETR